MNRFTLTSILCFSTLVVLFAQDISLCSDVIASTGLSIKKNGRYYAYTVGEPIIRTYKGGNKTVTQGFHQPEICLSVSTNETLITDWGLTVYPNPAETTLQIAQTSESNFALKGQIVDISGKVIISSIDINNNLITPVDCSNWQPGVYFLQVYEENALQSVQFKVIKL